MPLRQPAWGGPGRDSLAQGALRSGA